MTSKIAALAFLSATYLAASSMAALAAGSPEQILQANKAAMGGSAWDSKQAARLTGLLSGQGLTGATIILSDLKDGRSFNQYNLGPYTGAQGFDGHTPWLKDSSGTITEQKGGDTLVLSVNDAYRGANGWWKPGFGGATIAGKGEVADKTGRYDVLVISPKGGKPFEAWFDTTTHLLAKTVEVQGSVTVATSLSDYRDESGVKVPHKLVIDQGMGDKYLQTVTITKVDFVPTLPASTYAKPVVTVTDFAIAGGAAETTVPVKIINNHLYGDAKINGKGPYLFIFDTGGHNIITPTLAKELGIKVEGNLAGGGAGEAVMEAGLANGITLDVGAATVKNQLFLSIPLDQLSEIEGVPMPGMVGYETFRRFVTRIDYAAGTVTLIDPKKFDPKDAGTPVKFEFNDHIPEVKGTFEGLPAKFDIDTGSRSEVTITRGFAEAHKLRASHPKGVEAVDGWGVGGPSTGYVTRGASMSLGDVPVGPVIATLADQAKGAFAGAEYSGNVGGGILKRFTVTFDYGNQIMYLKPRPGPVADTFTYDRAGLWLNIGGGGFRVVSLTKNAPAIEAGLAEGDIIVSIDGKPASEIKLGELRQHLRSDKPGTVLNLKVNRDGKSFETKLTLRDLI